MIIETERLYLYPLKPDELILWYTDINTLEKKLDIKYDADEITGVFKDIIKSQSDITLHDKQNYVWHTFWLIITKTDRIAVGSADFKDIPDKNGEVEIGYGLGEKHTKKGYMTEAVRAMCKWAFESALVKSIVAETETDNEPSKRLLTRCGFKKYLEGETLWWRLDK